MSEASTSMSGTPPAAQPALPRIPPPLSPGGGERRRLRRSFFFGVSNGALLLFADALIHPVLVLAVFVDRLSDSRVLVGLVPALSVSMWFLPQAIAAALVEGRRRQLPWAAWAGVVRALAVGIFAAIVLSGGFSSERSVLVTFFLCYALYNLAAGFAFVPLVELSARSIPADRRGFFFSQRNLWGAVLALVAGFVVQRALAGGEAGFSVLFAMSFAALALAAYTTLWIAERPVPERTRSILSWLQDVPLVLSRRSVRRFLVFRSFLALSTIADPFFIVYAQHRLGVPPEAAGFYLALSALARVVTNPLWGWVVSRWGNRLLLQLTTLLRLGMPLLALALGGLLRWDRFLLLGSWTDRLVFWTFAVVFIIYGAALAAQMLANFTAVLELAGPDERPTLVGVTNSLLGLVALVPLLGGLVVDRVGFEAVFVLALALALLALGTSGLLTFPSRTPS